MKAFVEQRDYECTLLPHHHSRMTVT
jgi:hypothetical protein